MIKAQAMVESGGSKSAFLRDPLQVNNPGDWPPPRKDEPSDKSVYTMLTDPHQPMTPAISAYAAMQWLEHKGHFGTPNLDYRGNHTAYRRYNAKAEPTGRTGGRPTQDWYADEVQRLADEGYGGAGK